MRKRLFLSRDGSTTDHAFVRDTRRQLHGYDVLLRVRSEAAGNISGALIPGNRLHLRYGNEGNAWRKSWLLFGGAARERAVTLRRTRVDWRRIESPRGSVAALAHREATVNLFLASRPLPDKGPLQAHDADTISYIPTFRIEVCSRRYLRVVLDRENTRRREVAIGDAT